MDERCHIAGFPGILGTWYALLINSMTLSRSHLQFSESIGSVIAASLHCPFPRLAFLTSSLVLLPTSIPPLWTAARALSAVAVPAGLERERQLGVGLAGTPQGRVCDVSGELSPSKRIHGDAIKI